MANKKSYYTALNFDGFKWAGYWDNFHHFTKKESKGYLEIRCTDIDILDGNLQDMIKLGMTK
jgi:hypothetical protein